MMQSKWTTAPLLSFSLLLFAGCGGDDGGVDAGGGDGDASASTGGADSSGGDGDSTASGGGDATGGGDVAFTVTLSDGEVDVPPLTGSFVLGNDDGALRYTVTMTGTAGSVSFSLRREGDEPWEPGSYAPELLNVFWFDEEVTCSFAEGNLDGRMLTVELTQLDPVAGSFEGQATCTAEDSTFVGTLTGTFDDS